MPKIGHSRKPAWPTVSTALIPASNLHNKHQLILPLTGGRTEPASVFEIPEAGRRFDAILLNLQEVKQIGHEMSWLRYKVTGQVLGLVAFLLLNR